MAPRHPRPGTPVPVTEPTCFRALDSMLAFIGDHADVWLGWAWWAAGPWWGNYPLTGNGTEDKPQMVLLDRHLTAP